MELLPKKVSETWWLVEIVRAIRVGIECSARDTQLQIIGQHLSVKCPKSESGLEYAPTYYFLKLCPTLYVSMQFE